MQRTDTVAAFRAALDVERAAGRRVGLVPTMGALHAGHASLIARAAAECGAVAVTAFVNPLQFDSAADLAAYPSDPDGDAAAARAAGATHLFAPSPAEMGTGTMRTTVAVAGVADDLEGAARPGHFTGVATVVARLFAIAGPCRAYFGEKDPQQLAVVRRLVADLAFPVAVVACPTVRDVDGLALSSRNARLSPDQRRAAAVLHRALRAGAAALGPGGPAAAEAAVAAAVAAEPRARLDYAAARPEGEGRWRLHVAARFGATRLIDNLVAPE